MLARAISASSISVIILTVLLLGQASAAPSLSLGSKASYNLSLSFKTSQSCNTSPLAYNQTACGPPIPAYHVSIIDYGMCMTNNGSCFFSPANITVLPGNPVVWTNLGQLPHTVTSNNTANGSLPSFTSGTISTNGQYTFTFTQAGTYHYYCSIHPWLRGTVTVSASAIPPNPVAVVSQVTPPPITVSGNLGWTVVGLDSNTAVLNMTHSLSVIVDNIPIAPVSETGSFQTSIDLATRVESHGTAIEAIDNFAVPLLALLSSSAYGTGALTAADAYSASLPTIYTAWWVNGPLSNGSPVQIIIGYSSVQGDETVHLPVGDRSAWIVNSNVAEDLTAFLPGSIAPPAGTVSTNNANARLALKFDFDKASDLLLSSADSAVITSTSSSVYAPGQTLCGSSGLCVPVSSLTTVTHVMTVSATASLTLSSTSLNLDNRMHLGSGNAATGTSGGNGNGGNGPQNGGSNPASTLPNTLSQPIVYAIAGVVAVGVVSALVWTARRRGHMTGPLTEPTSQPSIPTP